jgi:hypothetical protein
MLRPGGKWHDSGMVTDSAKAAVPTADELIGAVQDDSQRDDARTLVDLFARVTGHSPKVWSSSMIGFGDLHYTYASGREGDTFLVGFAPRKGKTVIYNLLPAEHDEEILARLGKVTTGKGCLYVKRLSDVDLTVLEEMTRRALAEHQGDQ